MKDNQNRQLNKKDNVEIAIEVENVSKNFIIPHEKVNSIRGAFISAFKKKNYENLEALKNISFKIKKGEFFGIVGRNGSGKSTLLKVLAGIYESDSGKVKVEGLISPFLELGIGFNPELSGRDNVYLNATVLGMTKKEIDKKFDSIVKFSELERFIDQKLKKYSSGMQVRLAFAVSIHANRDILLMDEVLAVGDTNFQSKCLSEFNKYREMGRTVVIVTHDIAVVERYCDRALLLKKGEIVKIGKADEVVDEYIQSNISDENRRMLSETKEIKDKKADKDKKDKKDKKDQVRKSANILKKKNIDENVEKVEKKQEAEKKVVIEKIDKVAEIVDVKFLDGEGREKGVFETGEAMRVKIEYKINKKIEKINFGFGIHSEFAGQVFGYNTQADKFKADKSKNVVYLEFKEMPILKGDYFVNATCFRNIGEVCYDSKVKYKKLKFYSRGHSKDYAGMVNINHKWKC